MAQAQIGASASCSAVALTRSPPPLRREVSGSVGCGTAAPVSAKNIDSSGLSRSSSRRTATPSRPRLRTNESSCSSSISISSSPVRPAARAHARVELRDLERTIVLAGDQRVGRRRRLCVQLRRGAAPHDPTAGNDGEAVARRLDLADQMTAQQHSRPLCGQLPQERRRPRARRPGQARSLARRAAAGVAPAAVPRRFRAAGASRTSSCSPGHAHGRADRRAPERHRFAAGRRRRPTRRATRGSLSPTDTDRRSGPRRTPRPGPRLRGPTRAPGGRTASIDPASGATSPNSMRSSVVFPAPLGPSNPRTSPARTSRPTPSTAIVLPKRLARPLTRTATGAVAELGSGLLVIARVRPRRWWCAVGAVDRSPDDAVELSLGEQVRRAERQPA